MNKIFFLLLLIPFGAMASAKGKAWQRLKDTGSEILRAKASTQELRKKHDEFKSQRTQLERMGYKEDETEDLDTRVDDHVKLLADKVYERRAELELSFLSFQQDFDFKNSRGKSKLITTNNVVCLGGSTGIANKNFHYKVDGCVFYGKGYAGSKDNKVTFEQKNIDTYGAKVSPSAGYVVSSLGSELGLKLPLLYTQQRISKPTQTSLSQRSKLQPITAVYFRFPANRWFLEVEFGRFLLEDSTLWGIGGGLKF